MGSILDGAAFRPNPIDGSAFAVLVAKLDRSVQGKLGGVSIAYSPKVGAAVTVTGLFDSSFVLAQGGAPAGVEAVGPAGPALFLRLSDLPADPEVDDPTITVGQDRYRVTERHPDGMGGVVLLLRLEI